MILCSFLVVYSLIALARALTSAISCLWLESPDWSMDLCSFLVIHGLRALAGVWTCSFLIVNDLRALSW